jgi:hypothetical protein
MLPLTGQGLVIGIRFARQGAPSPKSHEAAGHAATNAAAELSRHPEHRQVEKIPDAPKTKRCQAKS